MVNILLFVGLNLVLGQNSLVCPTDENLKVSCGGGIFGEVTKEACEQIGCCWQDNSITPCFAKVDSLNGNGQIIAGAAPALPSVTIDAGLPIQGASIPPAITNLFGQNVLSQTLAGSSNPPANTLDAFIGNIFGPSQVSIDNAPANPQTTFTLPTGNPQQSTTLYFGPTNPIESSSSRLEDSTGTTKTGPSWWLIGTLVMAGILALSAVAMVVHARISKPILRSKNPLWHRDYQSKSYISEPMNQPRGNYKDSFISEAPVNYGDAQANYGESPWLVQTPGYPPSYQQYMPSNQSLAYPAQAMTAQTLANPAQAMTVAPVIQVQDKEVEETRKRFSFEAEDDKPLGVIHNRQSYYPSQVGNLPLRASPEPMAVETQQSSYSPMDQSRHSLYDAGSTPEGLSPAGYTADPIYYQYNPAYHNAQYRSSSYQQPPPIHAPSNLKGPTDTQ